MSFSSFSFFFSLFYCSSLFFFFFFNDTATTVIYTLSLHDALPICALGFKSKAAITIYSDNHGNRQAWLHALRFGVKCLTKLHDIHTVLPQCLAYRWRRIGLTGLYLQFDIGLNFFSHDFSRLGIAPKGFPLIIPDIKRHPFHGRPTSSSDFFYLTELKLNGRSAPKNGNSHLKAALFVVDLFNHTIEISKGAVSHANRFANLEQGTRPGLLTTIGHTAKHRLRLPLTDWRRPVGCTANKAQYPRRVLDQMPS